MSLMTSDYKKQINSLIYKVERLVSALYMVTDLINSNDPIKWRIRKASIVLLTEIGKLAELTPADRKKLINTTNETLVEINSLLEVAATAGLISRMNYTLLKKEFANAPLLLERFGKAETFQSKGQIPGQSIGQHIGQTKIIKDKSSLSSIGQNSIIVNKVKKEARKAQIIKIFENGRTLSLSEVSDMFRGFGSKMLQRDLLEWVQNGVLKKIGNKRWSRYSLI
ncbi:MAG: Uncharacterized protein CEO19_177 [Parcubacteria group bacterium Gr01-1014_73]|nr:MAG: Uncharacterized protein CEO19_177 [Parcubacteria group bacterium Gr01-1014_73]